MSQTDPTADVEQIRDQLEKVRFDVAEATDADDLEELEELVREAGTELALICERVQAMQGAGAST